MMQHRKICGIFFFVGAFFSSSLSHNLNYTVQFSVNKKKKRKPFSLISRLRTVLLWLYFADCTRELLSELDVLFDRCYQVSAAGLRQLHEDQHRLPVLCPSVINGSEAD